MRRYRLAPSPLVTAGQDSGPLTFERLLKLQQREERDANGCYFTEGLRFAFSALETGARILGYAWCPEILKHHCSRDIISKLKAFPGATLTVEQFRQLNFAPEPQGIALVLRQQWEEIDRVHIRSADTWLGVESIRNPGNLGTILRSMSATGAAGLMVFRNRGQSLDPFDPLVLRASMGASIRTRLVRTSYRELSNWRSRGEVRVLGADAAGAIEMRRVKLRRPVLIMLGDERSGLSPGQRSACDAFVKVPMKNGVDSLNVAMAATVLLFEAYRQRHPVDA